MQLSLSYRALYRGRVYLVDWKSDILPSYTGKTMSGHVYHEYRVQAEDPNSLDKFALIFTCSQPGHVQFKIDGKETAVAQNSDGPLF